MCVLSNIVILIVLENISKIESFIVYMCSFLRLLALWKLKTFALFQVCVRKFCPLKTRDQEPERNDLFMQLLHVWSLDVKSERSVRTFTALEEVYVPAIIALIALSTTRLRTDC